MVTDNDNDHSPSRLSVHRGPGLAPSLFGELPAALQKRTVQLDPGQPRATLYEVGLLLKERCTCLTC